MKIAMITGSPHRAGTTALLAERFAAGAERAGHSVSRFDAAFLKVHPCLGCDYCVRSGGGVCIQKDDMQQIQEAVLAADLVALVSPMYYYGLSAQIKTVIDRFYGFNTALRAGSRKSVLLAACGDSEDWTPEAMLGHYAAICRYLGWESAGCVFARGVFVRADIEKTDYPAQAEALGVSL